MSDFIACLNRIGVDRVEPPSLEYLSHLQTRHLLTVPFENLSVVWGEPIHLDEAWLFDKIVRRRRGGFCYELNGLFAWLLDGLGFRVDRIAAGVYNSERGNFGPRFDHMALIVHLDRPYLVDVGFGDSARTPLPLPITPDMRAAADEFSDISGRYRLEMDPHSPDSFVLSRASPQDWTPMYTFSTHPHRLDEYVPMCHYHQTSPDSSFTRRTVCTLATPTGRITLNEDSLTLTAREGKTKTPVADSATFAQLLSQYFGVAQVPSV